MGDLFKQLFECREILEQAKQTLKVENIDLNDIFRELDYSNRGFITLGSIEHFASGHVKSFSNKTFELFL